MACFTVHGMSSERTVAAARPSRPAAYRPRYGAAARQTSRAGVLSTPWSARGPAVEMRLERRVHGEHHRCGHAEPLAEPDRVAVQRLELEAPALREVVVERGVGLGRQAVGGLHDGLDGAGAEVHAAGR